jgi:hypothetical protein
MVRVKEHFMGLQKISTNHESAPKTEFCMRYLQFRIQARNHNCSGLMEPDTFMRDNIVNHRGVNNDPKTQLQAVPQGI